MASGLSDRVDCARLADEAAVLERHYPLGELPRLQDFLADTRGSVLARFAFANVDEGRAGARVAVRADAQLICQRCLQGFAFTVAGDSEIEFVSSEADAPADSQREIYLMEEGLVSLRELAEDRVAAGIAGSRGLQHAADLRSSSAARGEAAAICRFAGFVEENLIGQYNPWQFRKAERPHRSAACTAPTPRWRHLRCRSTRRAARLIPDIAFPGMDIIAAKRCCRPRQMPQPQKNRP